MDLRHNQITIQELLADPRAREVLARRFPQAIDRPIVAQSGAMTLERAKGLRFQKEHMAGPGRAAGL